MDKLNILMIIDVYGWAYYWNTTEQSKFSQHHITIKTLSETTVKDLKDIDILYIHGPHINKPQSDKLIADCLKNYPKIKIIGVYSSECHYMYPKLDAVFCISSNFYKTCKSMYPDTPVLFMPKGIDDDFFTPATSDPSRFTVGWIGRKADVKRVHLLDRLYYSVKRRSEHGKRFFTKNSSQEPTKKFLHGLSCLVLTSSTEALPRVVLEAMACGLPVVSTRVGSLPLILPKEALVSVQPEHLVISEMNLILRRLVNDPVERKFRGASNRSFIERNWSWRILMPYWDTVFWNIYKSQSFSLIEHNKVIESKYQL